MLLDIILIIKNNKKDSKRYHKKNSIIRTQSSNRNMRKVSNQCYDDCAVQIKIKVTVAKSLTMYIEVNNRKKYVCI